MYVSIGQQDILHEMFHRKSQSSLCIWLKGTISRGKGNSKKTSRLIDLQAGVSQIQVQEFV